MLFAQDNSMKFKVVLDEALVHDRKDKRDFSPIPGDYSQVGRLKHVKEDVQAHLVNFYIYNGKLLITYINKISKYTPIKNGKTYNEIEFKSIDDKVSYEKDIKFADPKKFSSFKEFYDFAQQESINNNKWVMDLINRVISKGWYAVYNKQKKWDSRKPTNAISATNRPWDKLTSAVQFIMSENKTNSIQEFVSIRSYHTQQPKIRYKEDIKSDVERANKEILWSFNQAA